MLFFLLLTNVNYKDERDSENRQYPTKHVYRRTNNPALMFTE